MNINFSVIIPTHNRDDLLVRAINSALTQTKKPLEIIVVDDMLSEKTESIVNELASKSKIIKIKYYKNIGKKGALGSRNLAVHYAEGNYLAFLDDDDFWSNNYLKEVYKKLCNEKSDIVLTGRTLVDSNYNHIDAPLKNPPKKYIKSDFYLKNPGVACTNFVVSKECFIQVGGYDLFVKGSADKDIFMQLMEIGCKYSVIDEPLIHKWIDYDDQWSKNPARILPNVIRFYIKYFKDMGITYHIRMWYKILILLIYSIKSRIFGLIKRKKKKVYF